MTTRLARRVLVASGNAKKLDELRRVLARADVDGVEIVGLGDVESYPEPAETGATFAENALIKARAGAAATGLACVADDSGLSVDALSGMPGVLSARWSGRHGDDQGNLELVLAQLADVPDERRGAEFVSACALVVPGGGDDRDDMTVVEGRWRGEILRSARGDGGFGYDPIFLPEGSERAAAELSPEEKDAVSHRGRALEQLLPALRALVAGA